MSQEFHKVYCPVCEELNYPLMQAFGNLVESDFKEKTHLFNGRYENLYLEVSKLPGLEMIVEEANKNAANILGCDVTDLQSGFWLNAMGPGHMTTAHTHDDGDEMLSGVYYVSVPEDSGQLVLTTENNLTKISPDEGYFIFFSPSLLHEVTENKSSGLRLSIAFNFGKKYQED